jgi:hypothetical protein
MAAKRSTPRDRTPTLVRLITPAQLWQELTPAQQLGLRETLTTIGREWLVARSPREATPDE